MPTAQPVDRLVRKEVSLGVIRDIQQPEQHVGLRLIAPFLDVESDDVIFDYARDINVDGMAPARAEDAESELAQKDTAVPNMGRAAVIDWAIKDHYTASDVTRYREALLVSQQIGNTMSVPLTINSMIDGFAGKLARDAARRRRKLDNRIEHMIMTPLETGGITYNDGKIKFTVDFGRPADQTAQAPASAEVWSSAGSDPLRDILAVQEFMEDRYGIRMTRGFASRKVLNAILNSDKFAARTGLAIAGSAEPTPTPIDPRYLIDGWGPSAAQAVVERATGFRFIEYDAIYRTRPLGSTTVTNNRYLRDDTIYFIPNESDIEEIAGESELGFARTLTSPHPEGNWTPGYYEWERETVDPWGRDVGAGIKAFPVFPHLDLTYTLRVL